MVGGRCRTTSTPTHRRLRARDCTDVQFQLVHPIVYDERTTAFQLWHMWDGGGHVGGTLERDPIATRCGAALSVLHNVDRPTGTTIAPARGASHTTPFR